MQFKRVYRYINHRKRRREQQPPIGMRVFGRALGFGNHHAPQVGASLVIRPLHLAWRARLQLKAQGYRIVVVHDGDGVTGIQTRQIGQKFARGADVVRWCERQSQSSWGNLRKSSQCTGQKVWLRCLARPCHPGENAAATGCKSPSKSQRPQPRRWPKSQSRGGDHAGTRAGTTARITVASSTSA